MFLKEKVTVKYLLSGARLVHISSNQPISVVSAWVHAGSRFDPIGKEGLAHFFEHLLMKRTNIKQNRTAHTQMLEKYGIDAFAYTNSETAYFYQTQTNNQTLQSLSFLVDGLLGSVYDEEDLERERSVILNERFENLNNPDNYMWWLSNDTMWPKDMFGRYLFGTEESLRNIARLDLQEFYKKYYGPSNTVFVVVSDNETSEIEEKINKTYKTEDSFFEVGGKEGDVICVNNHSILRNKEHPDMVYVGLNYKTVPYSHKDRVGNIFVSYLLALGWSSHLVRALRLEKQYTYWVYSDWQYTTDRGFTRFSFAVQPENKENAISIAKERIKNLSSMITKEEVSDYKNIVIKNIINNNIHPERIMEYYGWDALNGNGIFPLNDFIQDVSNLSFSEVVQNAQEYFSSQEPEIAVIEK
jgi:predicted Zn-dependent peptidase